MNTFAQKVGGFFKKVGVAIKDAVTYLPQLEKKFAKAVTDAKGDSAEVIMTGKPFVSAIAAASAEIATAVSEKGVNWKDDVACVQAVEAALKLWPAFWEAIEKEGSDFAADLK